VTKRSRQNGSCQRERYSPVIDVIIIAIAVTKTCVVLSSARKTVEDETRRKLRQN